MIYVGETHEIVKVAHGASYRDVSDAADYINEQTVNPNQLGVVITPLLVTKEQAFLMVNSPRLVQRMLKADWLRVRKGKQGRNLLIEVASLQAAVQRLLDGEEPPLLPSERQG